MTGKHDEAGQVFPPSKDAEHAWSAVFISYVMRIAGAGARFPYSDAHWAYIRAAIDASLRGREGLVVRAETLHAYSPQPGDLVCSAPGRVAPLDLDGFPAGAFPSHCDIVITAEPPWLTVIGGNVSDAVTAKRVPVTEDGKLVGPDGRLLDPDHPWFVIVRVLYDR